MICAQNGDLLPSDLGAERFTRTYTMIEAAQVAAERNAGRLWSHCSTPQLYDHSMEMLFKSCKKEDNCLRDDPDRPYYVISPDGAIGRVCHKNGSEALEWIFFTDKDCPDSLPDSLTPYTHLCFE